MRQKYKKHILIAIIAAMLSASLSILLRDPVVDLSAYSNVIPSYKAKIKELRTATRLIEKPLYRPRREEGLRRLAALAQDESPIHSAAKKTLYYFYGEPERWQCAENAPGCPSFLKPFSKEQSKKAFFWARQLEGKEKIFALANLLRDWRVQPVAEEKDRVTLALAAEENTNAGLSAALALADHHLDKRYFKNMMIGEAALWLERAAEINRFL